jgi:hypothetical protein
MTLQPTKPCRRPRSHNTISRVHPALMAMIRWARSAFSTRETVSIVPEVQYCISGRLHYGGDCPVNDDYRAMPIVPEDNCPSGPLAGLVVGSR